MTLKTLVILILSLLFISCKKDAAENKESKTITDTVVAVVDSTIIDEDGPLSETKTAFRKLDIYRTETIEKLKGCTKEEGSKLFDDYEAKCNKILEFLNQSEEESLSDYESYYDHTKKEFVFPDGVKLNVREIAKSDVEFWDVGEGYAEIRLKPYHYYNLFKGKVTDDYEYLLKTEAKENAVLYSADAGLLISFQELGDRVLNWEYFMKKYPGSPLFTDAKKRYQDYAFNYILGMDNTPTAEWSADREIYEENLQEFNRFMAKNPKSDVSRVVKLYIEQYNNGTSLEDIQKMVNTELGIVNEKEI